MLGRIGETDCSPYSNIEKEKADLAQIFRSIISIIILRKERESAQLS